MKLSVIVDNRTGKSLCGAEWGLSLLIESEGHTYLFDTGASSMIERNSDAMGIKLDRVEACFISHGHYDHTEGLEAFCRANATAPVYIHEEAIHEYFAPSEEYNCGIRWESEFLESVKNRLVMTSGIYSVNDKITLVGNIPNLDGFIPTEEFHRKENGICIPDPMNHEQFLVFEEKEGIHLISGCCHKGALETVKYAKKLFPGKNILSFTAGMHTYMLDYAERISLAHEMEELGVGKVIPLHCTGLEMIASFKKELGEKCILASSGSIIEI